MFLEVKELSVSYGAVDALENVSLHINEGEIVALLGANGAGKSSMLDAISRIVPAKSGRIIFNGADITKEKPENVVRKGIAHCPEGRKIFFDLTVLENLQLGAYTVKDPDAVLVNLEKIFTYFPVLKDRRKQKGGTLSGGEQQMLAVGRSLMSSPKLLLLDEPSLGLAPKLIDQIFEIIRKINFLEKVTVFLIEQNANEALLHADRAYVLENGRISIISDNAEELLKNPHIIRAYLGG
ncbi:MAG TPA: branched-chain amino acid ABC transporter ATP-binding protein [Lentisphaeria bacterium]|nr:MAG: branched-chain amino acid ABC transporter ATP-binding protein [Lentisphaerae bacterium GWF2_50_93]HCE43072.1 branched-chain amino acid ABC transporter ATP-binding protein [Lentisphaeria bacterium]